MNISEIYLKKINEPQKNKIYFQFEDSIGFPVMIIDGSYFRNGRLSNSWTWRNILTGKKETGYGCFYEILKRKGEEINFI